MKILLLLLVVAVVATIASRPSTLQLSRHALFTLLNRADEYGITTIEPIVPIYRADLPDHHIAYWQVVINDHEYIVVSDGPDTGDYRVAIQGPLPPPTHDLDAQVRAHGSTCVRYNMLTPSGIMACVDKDGRVITTTHDNLIQFPDHVLGLERHNYTHNQFELHKVNFGALWRERADNVNEAGIWDAVKRYTNPSQTTLFYGRNPIMDTSVSEEELVPGHEIRIPLLEDDVFHVKAPANSSSNHMTALCSVLGVCSYWDLNSLRDMSAPVIGEQFGIRYIKLILNHLPEFDDVSEVRFQVEIMSRDGNEPVVHVWRFAMDRKSHITKRAVTTTSVPNESQFPDYNQHTYTAKGCAVGCGPVAWAMIFGFFDRLSHSNPSRYGTAAQSLWRCSTDGTSGANTCRAPSTTTSSVRLYTEHLNGVLGTFCLGSEGATPQGSMDNVESFYTTRMSGLTTTLQVHKDFLISDLGVYRDVFRDWMVHYLNRGWPAIVGIRVSGIFSQHYPVATRYRMTTSPTRRCVGDGACSRWRRTTTYEMYLHMGWGGSQNGWRTAEMFFTAAATFA